MSKKVPIKIQRDSVIMIKQQQYTKRQEQNQRFLKPVQLRAIKTLPKSTKQDLSNQKKRNRLKEKRSSAKIIHYPTHMHELWIDSSVNQFSQSLTKQQKITLYTSYINKSSQQKSKNYQKSKSSKKIEGWPSKYFRIQTQPTLASSKNQLFRVKGIPQIKMTNTIFQFSGHEHKPIVPLFQRVKPNPLK